jgi:hypothetical protein
LQIVRCGVLTRGVDNAHGRSQTGIAKYPLDISWEKSLEPAWKESSVSSQCQLQITGPAPVARMATQLQIEAAVIKMVQGYPYTESVILDSPLGPFFQEQDDIDRHQNRPVRRVDLFVRDLKRALGGFIPVTRDDLLEGMFPAVSDLVQAIADDLVE